MRLKSFQARTMQDALKQIKETLGDDAIIVSTREEASGWVRVTAAVEQIAPLAEKQTVAPGKPAYDEDTVNEMITETLLKHRVPRGVSDKIISSAMVMYDGDPKATLAKALAKTFTFAPADKKDNLPLILVGAPGAGKTLMTAKLATQAVMDGKIPAVITTDIARAGGVEQLSAFLNILDLPLYQADDADSLKKILSQTKGLHPVIIDTGGLNPFDPQEMRHLAKLMAVTDMNAAMVLAAGTDAEEAAEMAMTFDVLGVKQLIPTRLDFARRLGGILSAADKAQLTFREASHTPQVASGFTIMTPEKLADMLMPQIPKDSAQKDKENPIMGKRGAV